jgi:hypothetical protein
MAVNGITICNSAVLKKPAVNGITDLALQKEGVFADIHAHMRDAVVICG